MDAGAGGSAEVALKARLAGGVNLSACDVWGQFGWASKETRALYLSCKHMCSANYAAYYLKRIPPPSKSPLFNSEAPPLPPPRLYSPARTGLKAGYRSLPLMSPLSLLPFQANYISSGLCCLGRLTGSLRKRDLPCAVILPATQNSKRRLIRSSGCHI